VEQRITALNLNESFGFSNNWASDEILAEHNISLTEISLSSVTNLIRQCGDRYPYFLCHTGIFFVNGKLDERQREPCNRHAYLS
jgi:hypothetical protein